MPSPSIDQPFCKGDTRSSSCGGHSFLGQGANELSVSDSMTKTEILFNNFRSELTSLREATKDCLLIFCTDQERLNGDILRMMSRNAYLRRKIGSISTEIPSARDAIGEIPLRNSIEGVEESNSIGLDELEDASDCTENIPKSTTPPTKVTNSSQEMFDLRQEKEDGWASCFRLSFVDGASDGMPTRWRARNLERAKRAKQDREHEKYQGREDNQNQTGGGGGEKKIQNLIYERKSEILAMETSAISLDQAISSLRLQKSVLQKEQQHAIHEFKREHLDLRKRINKVEHDNSNLDRMIIETEVSLDEKSISTKILADELKRVRKDLIAAQNERDRLKLVGRRKESSRRKNHASAIDSGMDSEQTREVDHNRKQTQKTLLYEDLDIDVQQLHVSPDIRQKCLTLAISSDDDTGEDNNVHTEEGIESGYSQDLQPSPSHNSAATCISSLTLDPCIFVDILDQLERHQGL